jgi:N-acetylmuramic acid 6-phosphate etherase
MINRGATSHSRWELVVGIDGGGTKTEAVIGRVDQDKTILPLGRGTAGPANLQSRTADDAWQQCLAAIVSAISDCADEDRPAVQAIWDSATFSTGLFAMAGASSKPHADAFLNRIFAAGRITCPMITHDARPLIGGGTRQDCGIALIAGTGSFAYCRTADGTEDRCGGWGYLYGDEGSGYALGIAGLRAAVMAHDGRTRPTALVARFQEWLGQSDLPQWLTQLRCWDRDQIAGAAKIVCRCAAEGDQTAMSLIDQAATELAQHLTTLWIRQFQGERSDIVLAGGLLVGNEPLRQKVIDSFCGAGCQPSMITVVQRSSDVMIGMLQRIHLKHTRQPGLSSP